MKTKTKELLIETKDLVRIGQPINENGEFLKSGSIGSLNGQEDDAKLQSLRKGAVDWVSDGIRFFLSKKPNVENGLPPGYYTIKSSYESGIYLEKKVVMLDELFELPNPVMQSMLEDIRMFWTKKDKYKEHNITYKRGILLYGPPGCGKTSINNFLSAEIISKHQGIVIEINDPNEFAHFAPIIRLLEPNKPILAVIEDLDAVLEYSSTRQILNLLDGNLQLDNVVYVASTNYIERLEDRIKNRPSRFDRRYEVGYPDAISREVYITNKLSDEELATIDLAKWVKDTENMSLSHLKELIISCIILEVPYEETIGLLRRMYEMR